MASESQMIYIVDDEPAFRQTLARLVQTAGFEAQACESGPAFLEVVQPEKAGCLLLDLRMPGMDGLELVRVMRDRKLRLPVILISAYADVPVAVEAMKAGVVDVLEKPLDDDLLLDRISEALKQDAQQRREHRRHADVRSRLATLTPRERTVLEWVVAGYTSKQIAAELGINPSTVDVHRCRTMEKLGVSTATQLVSLTLEVVSAKDSLSRLA